MTTLQTRPPQSAATRTRPDTAERAPRAGRSLALSSALAGVGVALGGIVVLQAVALTGWFLADGGGHGTTRDALRVGADAWLVGHGSHLTYAGIDYRMVPLGLSLLLAWAAYRSGRWAGTVSQVTEDRELRWAGALLTAGYVVVAVVAAVLAGTPQARGSLVLTVIGALVLGGGAGTAGLLSGSGRWAAVLDPLPVWVVPVVRSALAVVAGVLAVSTVLVVVSFVLHLGAASSLLSELGLEAGDATMLALLSALLLPNAALLGTAYLAGPGFAIGTGTTISPGVVALGPMPAFPMLAALPSDGPTPWFATALMALPPLAAAVAVALVQRRHPVRAWDVAAIRGLGAGVLAGCLAGLLTGLAGGALGDGRMADLGASAPRVMVAASLSMGLGGLVGALVTTFFQRRHPVEEVASPDQAVADLAGEPVVLVPSRPDEQTVRLTRDAAGVSTGGGGSGVAAPEVVTGQVVTGQVVTGEVVDPVEELPGAAEPTDAPSTSDAAGAGAQDLLARFLTEVAQDGRAADREPDGGTASEGPETSDVRQPSQDPDDDSEDTVQLDRG